MEYEITSNLRGIQRGWIKIEGEKVDGKICGKCDVMKPLTEYTPNKNAYDGTFNQCRKCRAKRQAEYARENPEIRRKAERNWREKNPEKVKEMARRSRKRNAKGYARRLKEFYEKNPEIRSVYRARRRARKASLPNNFDNEWAELLLEIYGGCVVTGETEGLHWDHFIPLSTGKGGTTFGNMIPLKAELNLRKSDKNPIEFLKEIGYDDKSLYGLLFALAKFNGMSVEEYKKYVYECFEESNTGGDSN